MVVIAGTLCTVWLDVEQKTFIMKKKKEIQEIKKEWEDLCKKDTQVSQELRELSNKENGNITAELQNKENELREIGENEKRALAKYHQACVENVNERLAKEPQIEKERISKKFEKTRKGTNDWDSFMDEESLW
jgi:hypothetical protein